MVDAVDCEWMTADDGRRVLMSPWGEVPSAPTIRCIAGVDLPELAGVDALPPRMLFSKAMIDDMRRGRVGHTAESRATVMIDDDHVQITLSQGSWIYRLHPTSIALAVPGDSYFGVWPD
ncbi:hypothetical protein [Gordonia sp. N1V]|uniref:hypothetical protein n=1 Tax=Gordonia sp. N1V TaxID=3034163 RepID=UPI0023E14F06|nr:hypothetical protein [Gordonia sp. N1V]MDF3280876.1 hypothetical protein [Gordonia sp. N1V]